MALAAFGGSLVVHGLAFAWAVARDPATPPTPPALIPLSLVALEEEGPSLLAAPAAATAPPARVRRAPIAEARVSLPSSLEAPAAAPAEVAAVDPTQESVGLGGGSAGERQVFGEGEVDRAAQPAFRIRPRYPERARVMGRESDVRMVVTVEADGVVSGVELVQSGGDEFDREARLALERSHFEPAHKAGIPVAAMVTFTVRFRLDEE